MPMVLPCFEEGAAFYPEDASIWPLGLPLAVQEGHCPLQNHAIELLKKS
jgi:hypothetical protein